MKPTEKNVLQWRQVDPLCISYGGECGGISNGHYGTPEVSSLIMTPRCGVHVCFHIINWNFYMMMITVDDTTLDQH